MSGKKESKEKQPHSTRSRKRSLRGVSNEAKTVRLEETKAETPLIHRYFGGAWKMHLPFAYDLMRELRPGIFVELGVHRGESYFAFCQSVEENRVAAKCYGIDTWHGDIQAGIYGPEIGNEVAAYNSRYSRFSHLMAMTFKAAAGEFADGSIDLLHIDGAHRYEDVKEDFATWLPKLSKKGVVLFHDVTERDNGFGVYRLWQEIARPGASFLFEFGHGLGVWQKSPVSKTTAPFLRRLFLADSSEKQAITNYYASKAAAVETLAINAPDKLANKRASAYLESFAARGGESCAEYVSKSAVETGKWCRLKIDLPWGLGDASAPFRIDPVDRAGVVDIASVALRAGATGEILWHANARTGFDELTVRGTGFRLSHPRLLRLIAYSTDPQVYLPQLESVIYQEALLLELLLRFDDAPDSIERVIRFQNESVVSPGPSAPPPEPEELSASNLATGSVTEITEDASKLTMTVYSAEESGYTEERGMQVTYTAQRWSHLNIALQLGLGRQPLRLDPLTAIGLVDVAAITIRSAINDEVLWRANGGGGLEALQVSGSAVRIPHPHLARILSYGEDPQIYLPTFPSGQFDGPLRLEVWLKTETGFNSIRRGIMDLAAISSRALEQDSQTRGLLEQTTRDASNKDTEIQSLQTELEKTRSERALEVENLKAALESKEAESSTQQAHIRNLETIRSEQALEVENLKAALETRESESSSQQANIRNLETIRSERAFEVENLKAALESKESESSTQQAHIRNLETIKRDRELEIENLRTSLKEQQTESGCQRAHLDNLEASRKEAESEVSALHQSLHQARIEVAEARAHFEAECAKQVELRAALREMEARDGDRNKQVESLKASLEKAEQEKNTLEEEVKSLRRDLENARKDLVVNTAHLDKVRHQLAEREDKARSLLRKLAEVHKDLEASNARLAGHTDELGKVRVHLAVAENELAFFQRQLEEVHKKTASDEARLKQADQELTKTRTELVSRTLEHGDVHGKFLSTAAELERTAASLADLAKQSIRQQKASDELSARLMAAQKNIRIRQRELEQIRKSVLWQSGEPFRKLSRHLVRAEGVSAAEEDQAQTYRSWLDSAKEISVEGESITLAGWVVGPPTITIHGVRVCTEEQIFAGIYGSERPDVAAVFGNRPDALHSGFSIDLALPVGVHELSLAVLSGEGLWETFHTLRHEVISAETAGRDAGEAADATRNCSPRDLVVESANGSVITYDRTLYDGTLETPGEVTINDTGLLCVRGWLHFKKGKIARLLARMEEGANASITYSLPREDVARAFPQSSAARASGFEGYLPVGRGFSGRTNLEVAAVLTDGTEVSCFRREISIELPSPATYPEPRRESPRADPYTQWVETNQLTPYLIRKMARDAHRIATSGPLISVIVPTYNTLPAYLEALIDSLRLQIYPNWQLCLADDASSEPRVRTILEKAAAADSRVQFRIRPTNGHIVKATNSALELARGDYVGLLDHDDLLTPDALLQVAEAISAQPALDLVYTDEDKLSPDGQRYDPIFKGSFSPEMSITHNYIQHFTVIRRSLVHEIGGFREGFEGAQDLDLYLRVIERTIPGRIRHLPFVCYHWRSHPESTASTGAQKDYVFKSAHKAITEALARRKIRATAVLPDFAAGGNCCLYQLKWSPELLRENPVTIIIPSKNRGDLLEKCIASIMHTVNHFQIKLIVVDDFSDDKRTRSYLEQLSSGKRLNCQVIRPRSQLGEFNFSHLVNTGVAHATTPLVLLLNNDTEALQPGWLEDMVGWMSLEGVGAVGAKLLYPDGTIQHAGVIVGSHGGLAEHIFHRLDNDIIGLNFLSHAARNVTAVTAACMLTSKAIFNEVKGFDEANFAMEYNDVDYCLRLGRAGKRIVFTPQATLLHHCGQSRGVGFRPREHVNFLRQYSGIKDQFYNESLTLEMPVTVNPCHFVHAERVTKLRVLDISHNLNLEGAPKVSFDRASYFASEAGYNITVASHSDGPLRKFYEEAGISVAIVKPPSPILGESATEYADRLQEVGQSLDVNSFDLIVCNTLITFWGALLAKSFALPVIWHIHESTPLEKFFQHVPAPPGLIDSCLAYADRIAFEAESTRRIFHQYDSKGKFVTLPGSVDVDAIDAFCKTHSPASLRRKHGIDPETIVVSLIGTTCERKGQHVFVDAIRKLQFEGPPEIGNVRFVMLGGRESPYLEFLEEQLRESGITNTLVIGEREEVYDFYRLTDIFVCASFQESFPRVILEAMAFKLGIVSTNVFGIAEMIADGEEGYLVGAGDSYRLAERILWLVQNPSMRRHLGEKAHSKVTRLFNNRVQLRKRLELTKEVVAKHI